eukprot:NODE_7172_length_803_cov_56.335294_g6566_i0.p1 GENE.NODE_7172_length_803_cov_56.335294_g6566_i0~~NODE_7172_length_803_cov_56.335294_g6566_i0.p1  ORF type:complete len:158 (-),score=25.19 NODE_7172_length_803_cov_56.335294_g6566_i0:330-767(-)
MGWLHNIMALRIEWLTGIGGIGAIELNRLTCGDFDFGNGLETLATFATPNGGIMLPRRLLHLDVIRVILLAPGFNALLTGTFSGNSSVDNDSFVVMGPSPLDRSNVFLNINFGYEPSSGTSLLRWVTISSGLSPINSPRKVVSGN